MISENPSPASSRPRGRPRTRVEVEDVLRLHLPSMMAARQVVPGEIVRTGLPERLGAVVAEMKATHGQLVMQPAVGCCYLVQIASAPQPFGGRRWWLVCPVTGQHTAALYQPHGTARFASRQVYRLGYRTQRLGERGRAEEREVSARMALGGAAEPGGPIPDRPKGMRQATYRRLLKRAGSG